MASPCDIAFGANFRPILIYPKVTVIHKIPVMDRSDVLPQIAMMTQCVESDLTYEAVGSQGVEEISLYKPMPQRLLEPVDTPSEIIRLLTVKVERLRAETIAKSINADTDRHEAEPKIVSIHLDQKTRKMGREAASSPIDSLATNSGSDFMEKIVQMVVANLMKKFDPLDCIRVGFVLVEFSVSYKVPYILGISRGNFDITPYK